MTTDPTSLEASHEHTPCPDRIAGTLRRAYRATADAFDAEIMPEVRLDAIVGLADRTPHARRTQVRPRRWASLRGRWAALRRRCGAVRARLSVRLRPGAVTSMDGRTTGAREAMDEGWLEQLWRLHREDLFRYLVRQVGNSDVAEDLTQQAFMAAWRQREQIVIDHRAWLFGVARNLAREHWRAHRREYRAWQRQATTAVLSNDGGIGESELLMAMEKAWNRLTRTERECLLLSVNHGLNDSAIASCQGTSRENVRQRRHRARWKLYDALGDRPLGRFAGQLDQG